VLLCGFHK